MIRNSLFLLSIGFMLNGCQLMKTPVAWEQSIVSIKIDCRMFNYFQPWSSREENILKMGVVIGAEEILTTAMKLQDSTLVRVQKDGRGKWWDAKILWVDYYTNLALIGINDPSFWNGLKPVELAKSLPKRGAVQVLRWTDAASEDWNAEVTKLSIDRSRLDDIRYPKLHLNSKMPSGGWSEPVTKEGRLVGITDLQDDERLEAIPAPFIQSVLQARKNGHYRGLGYFGFHWQPAESPVVLQYLQYHGEPHGVIVNHISSISAGASPLCPKDIIIEINGFPIDTNGFYDDPQYGRILFDNLATRDKWAGDQCRFKVWREGKLTEFIYTLPKMDFDKQLVPANIFDRNPEYAIIGGLVFQPLVNPYFQEWGNNWATEAPFRLTYFSYEEPTQERANIVFLSQILPDDYNLGYQDHRYLVVDQVNDRTVHRLEELYEALQHHSNGFHRIQFIRGREVQRIVLDASELSNATHRVLERYGIEKDRFIHRRSIP